jgi:hypothetical protein
MADLVISGNQTTTGKMGLVQPSFADHIKPANAHML